MDKQIEVTGYLDLKIDGWPANLEIRDNYLHVYFSSFSALRRFDYSFRFGVLRSLSPQHPFLDWMHRLTIYYYVSDYLIGEMGPQVKTNWWSRYVGLRTIRINIKMLLKALASQFLKAFKMHQ